MTRLVLTLLILGLTVGCERTPERADADLSLEALGAAWSADRAAPECKSTGPRGEYLGGLGQQYCQWPTVAHPRELGIVSGTTAPELGFVALTWERGFDDPSRVLAVRDSLGDALTTAGLIAHECPADGRRWQRDGLAIQFSTLPPGASGRSRVIIQATTLPGALPSLLCPSAPPMKAALSPARRSPIG